MKRRQVQSETNVEKADDTTVALKALVHLLARQAAVECLAGHDGEKADDEEDGPLKAKA